MTLNLSPYSCNLLKIRITLVILAFLGSLMLHAESGMVTRDLGIVTSPDEQIVATFSMSDKGVPHYSVSRGNSVIVEKSDVGVVFKALDFSNNLHFLSADKVERVEDCYEILTAKRQINHYLANRRVFHLESETGRKMDIVFQVSNDGVAFHYAFPEKDEVVHQVIEEKTSFIFSRNKTRAWIQPMAAAKTGWSRTNPSYEENYKMEIPVGTASPTGAGWVFPALFRTGKVWISISEGSLDRTHCGSRLKAVEGNGDLAGYRIAQPDPREILPGGAAHAHSGFPWKLPWRIITVGDLKTVTESMLAIDLAESARFSPNQDWIQPGKASWSWVLLKDDKTIYSVQKDFIDYAADMGWQFCLVDALWDRQIGYEGIQNLIDYGKTRGVGIILWYNSAGEWNDAFQTPKNMLLTRESREREFARLQKMGVAGLKIDFFGGDGQSVIAYYIDILEDAAKYELLINFHGATLPRGWQRTFPHLMTVEAIKGEEMITFEQDNADQQPAHCAMLPFTRNLFDPMDFTPMVLDQIPNIERRTTSCFELALSVLFTSGIQHYAETPAGMTKAPDYVKAFLRSIPDLWEDIEFIDGEPGKLVVLGRKGDGKWFLAGINGEDRGKEITIDADKVSIRGRGILISDESPENLAFTKSNVELADGQKIPVKLQPYGGFVIMLED